jgi:hypothetical protein
MGFLTKLFGRRRTVTMNQAAAEIIAHHLREKGIPTKVRNNAFVAESLGYPCECRVFLTGNEPVRLQLDITTALAPDSDFGILESMAGTGVSNQAALTDGAHKWLHSVFPVLETGLSNQRRDEVQTYAIKLPEQGKDQATDWIAYVGPVLCMSTDRQTHEELPMFQAVAPVLQTVTADGDIGWIKSFIGGMDPSSLAYECLLTNDPWTEGSEALRAIPWPAHQSLRTARQFTVLRRAK